MHAHRLAFLLCCSLLAACGGNDAASQGKPGEDGLPKPAAASGSVTGMPDPGVASARRTPGPSPEPDLAELPEPVDTAEIASVDPAMQAMPGGDTPAALAEPTLAADPNMPAALPGEQAAATADPAPPRQ